MFSADALECGSDIVKDMNWKTVPNFLMAIHLEDLELENLDEKSMTNDEKTANLTVLKFQPFFDVSFILKNR